VVLWHLAGGRLLECGDGAVWLVTVFRCPLAGGICSGLLGAGAVYTFW
jgi:hypothetical protein